MKLFMSISLFCIIYCISAEANMPLSLESIKEIESRIKQSENGIYENLKLILYFAIPIGALAAFFGLKSLQDAIHTAISSSNFDRILNSKIEDAIEKKLNKDMGNVEKEIFMLKFNRAVIGLDQSDSFSNSELSTIMKYFRKIISLDPSNKNDPEFLVLCEKLLDSTFSSNRLNEFSEIEEQLKNSINFEEFPGLFETFLQHYGFQCLGSIERDFEIENKFKFYIGIGLRGGISRKTRWLTCYLPYILHKKEKDYDSFIGSYLSDLGDKKDDFWNSVEKRCDVKNLQKTANVIGKNVADKHKNFFDRYNAR